MESRKCMIAGLPSSGKSTYIGALWYNLCNSNEKMLMRTSSLASDISLLEKLGELWEACDKIERNSTEQNIVDDVEINLELKDSSKTISLCVPDFWGEKFYNIIDLANTREIEEWCEGADSLFYMVHDVRHPILIDDDKLKKITGAQEFLPPMDTKSMSPAALNIMILKYLFDHKRFKRFVLAVTHWDEIVNDVAYPENPEEWLKSNSPALYNFVKYYCPEVYIIGLSAQGCKYDQENFDKNAWIAKTLDGKRAFLNDADGISYDLSKPLNFLLS